MKLSPVVGRYFDAWLRLDTWDSYHPLDKERFYLFVKAVARYSRRVPSAGDIKELIVEKWKDRRTISVLNKATCYFMSLYQEFLAYEKTRGFPNPSIERTNIVRFYYRIRQGKTNKDIDMRMSEDWGSNWQRKLDEKLATLGQPSNKGKRTN